MRFTASLAMVVILAGCSKDADEPALSDKQTTATSKPDGPTSSVIPDFSAQDALSPEHWKPAIGSALPVSADAVKITHDGAVLTFATSVQAGRTDIDYTQPIDGDFRLTLRVGVRSQMTERARHSPVVTNAWFQVHTPSERGRNVAAPIYLPEPNAAAVIQILRSGDEVRCLCDGQQRGSRKLSGPLQFGVWINGVGEVDVHEFLLEAVTPQLAARNPSSNSGNFANGPNPYGGPAPGFAAAPPSFGPGPPGMQSGFGGPPPGTQGGFGSSAANGFGGVDSNNSPPVADQTASNLSPVESEPLPTATIPVESDPFATELLGEPIATYPLPAPVSRVVVAGGGRYLLLDFRQIEKLGLYDVEQRKITKLLSLRGNPFIAAGAEQIIVISDKDNAIVKLGLSDLQIEGRGQVPGDLQVLELVMGSASAGPALLLVPGDAGRVSAKFIDIHSLSLIEPRRPVRIEADPAQNTIRAASGGHVFTVSGQPVWMIDTRGSEITMRGHTRLSTLIADSRGQTFFTDQGLWDGRMRPIDSPKETHPAIPATTGPFYLSVGTSASENEAGPVALHLLPSGRRIAAFHDLKVTMDPVTFDSGTLPLDQRLVLHAASGTIVALDEANDKLHIKRFDLKELLDRIASNYLLVTSQPPPSIPGGAIYRYQLDVLSSGDEVSYELASAPAAMSVSPSGLVTWQTAADDGGKLYQIVMNVRQSGGESMLHTFTVLVVGQPQLAASTPATPPATGIAAALPPSEPMAQPTDAEVADSASAPGDGDAAVAREPRSRYVEPEVFGFEIPPGETTLPEDQRVTTNDEDGVGVVAQVYVDVGENRIVMLPNGKLVARSKEQSPFTERPFRAATRKQITDQLAQRFPRFQRSSTRHFNYVHNTSPNFYTATSRILETMLPGLQKFAEDQGLEPHDPQVPMVVIMFRTEAEFQLYGAPAGALAYYSIVSNEIVMHEESPLWKTHPDLALKDTIATIAHEGSHQILANIGIQKRLSMWPMWLSEGLAEYLSPTSFGKDLRWKGAGATHDLRMSSLQFYFQSRGLEETDEDMIKFSVSAYRLTSSGYASAWAITHYLATNEEDAFAAHLREVSSRQPLERQGDIFAPGGIPQNLELFTKHFDDDLPAMEERLIEHLNKLPYIDPYARCVHYLATAQWRADGKQRREANIFPMPEWAQKWVGDKRRALSAAGATTASFDIQEFKNRPLAERNAVMFLRR